MRIATIAPLEHDFYGKCLDAFGTVIKAHVDVSDEALLEAGGRVMRLLVAAPALAANLAAAGAELHVIGRSQQVTDLPMYRHLAGLPYKDGKTMDERGRGYGGLHCCCSEDSLLKLESARHHRDHRDICSHEFAHAIHAFGLDSALRTRVEQRYAEARPLWGGAYGASNVDEFFAELTMWYVGSRGDFMSLPSPEPGPDWLAQHDPESFALLDGIYSGRLAPEPIVWEQLEPSAERRSDASLFPVSLLLVNDSDRAVERFWLDANGRPKSYGPIPPAATLAQPTFAGHPWALVDDRGNELGVFVATGAPHAHVLITQEQVDAPTSRGFGR